MVKAKMFTSFEDEKCISIYFEKDQEKEMIRKLKSIGIETERVKIEDLLPKE